MEEMRAQERESPPGGIHFGSYFWAPDFVTATRIKNAFTLLIRISPAKAPCVVCEAA